MTKKSCIASPTLQPDQPERPTKPARDMAPKTREGRQYEAHLRRQYGTLWYLLIFDRDNPHGGYNDLDDASFGEAMVRALKWANAGLADVFIHPEAPEPPWRG